jgi:hypothetical protein
MAVSDDSGIFPDFQYTSPSIPTAKLMAKILANR